MGFFSILFAFLVSFPCSSNSYNPSISLQYYQYQQDQKTLHLSRNEHNEEEISQRKLKWLIIGGGIHGVHIAARLLATAKKTAQAVPPSLCIIDENESLLQKWKSRTANTGMQYLRSSAGYHLDVDKNSLRRQFADKKYPFFAKDYERPRLDIFNQHCDSVIEKYNLHELHEQGRVVSVEPKDDHVRAQTVVPSSPRDSSMSSKIVTYKAEKIVLALGNDDPIYPEWIHKKDVEQGLVRHLLDDGQKLSGGYPDKSSLHKNIAVIGGGITASHKVLELVNRFRGKKQEPKTIHLISRHPMKEQQFDTHQDWMMDRAACKRSQEAGGSGMPKRQRMFAKSSCFQERRNIIMQERIPGTVTPAVNRGKNGLRYAIENGSVQWHQAEILNSERLGSNGSMKLVLSNGDSIEVDQILLATGFGKRLPGVHLLTNLIETAGLKVSNFCGYPIVDKNLAWHPRIFVAGALAELELGPSARNIAGARLAAERIIQYEESNLF